MNVCRKGIPCEYATINGFCQLTACLKHLREIIEECQFTHKGRNE